ncbi:hypothetical protein SMICM304S_07053 [Streptomyces microflavus]
MHWGQGHGAAYQLLQTEVGGPSDKLCLSEGLTSLGFSHTTRRVDAETVAVLRCGTG